MAYDGRARHSQGRALDRDQDIRGEPGRSAAELDHADEHSPVHPADQCLLKKVENHVHAVSLHMMFYNFCRIHKTLRITPAMAAGVSDHVWSVEEIVALVARREALEDGSLLVG